MKQILWQKAKPCINSVLAVTAVGSLTLLSGVESAKAAAECGLSQGSSFTGTGWVSNCPAGVDVFPNSWAKILVSIPELSPDPFFVKLGGPATITRQAGSNGQILTTINETLTGQVHLTQIPGVGEITLTGNGTGAIQDPDGDGFASSFFDVFTTIDVDTINGPLTLNTTAPVTVNGDRPLVGVSPDTIIPPGPRDLALQPECSANGTSLAIPPIAIAYCGNSPVNLVDQNGTVRGTILAEVHTVHPVPEPTSVLASIAVFGAMFSLKRKGK